MLHVSIREPKTCHSYSWGNKKRTGDTSNEPILVNSSYKVRFLISLVYLHFFNQPRRCLTFRRVRDTAMPTGAWSGTHCLVEVVRGGLSVTSDATELGCLTGPALDNPCSGSGMSRTWLNSCGWSWIAGRIWRRFLKFLAPASVCISHLLSELSVSWWITVTFCQIGFLRSNWKRTLWNCCRYWSCLAVRL